MVSELIKYIEDCRKSGFEDDHIKAHLHRNGWNPYLVDFAYHHADKRADRKWLQGSVMAVIIVVLLSTGVVWFSEGYPSTPQAPGCLLQSMTGAVTALDSQDCCARISASPCQKLSAPAQVKGPTGAVILATDMACNVDNGKVLVPSKAAHSCKTPKR